MRERLRGTMEFQEVDRVPWWEQGILPAALYFFTQRYFIQGIVTSRIKG